MDVKRNLAGLIIVLWGCLSEMREFIAINLARLRCIGSVQYRSGSYV